MKFQTKLILMFVFVVLIMTSFSYSILMYNRMTSVSDTVGNNLYETAVFVATNQSLIENLEQKKLDGSIQTFTQELISVYSDVDIIVIGDMETVKYSHLDESQIGTTFVNRDVLRVIEEGVGYHSLMTGSQGKTERWFEPIYSSGEQIGFVMVGKYYDDIVTLNQEIRGYFLLVFGVSISISIGLAIIFSAQIKKEILGMEPKEITKIYLEKQTIFNSVRDGLIALDEKGKLVEVNNKIYELFPMFEFEHLKKKLGIYIDDLKDVQMKEFIIDQNKYIVSINHLTREKLYIGCIITINSKSQYLEMSEEITGVNEVVKSLRATTHEFKNHLFVILGLLEIDEYEKAKDYIMTIQSLEDKTSSEFENIEDNLVKALLKSYSRIAKERGLSFHMSEESTLESDHGLIESLDLITIIGNLIENAFDACQKNKGCVCVSFSEYDTYIKIDVVDNGIQLEQDVKDAMFEQGFSTKGQNRGHGLYLVKSRIDVYHGELSIKEEETTKTFTVLLPKEVL